MNPKQLFLLLYVNHSAKWFLKQFILFILIFFGITSGTFSQIKVSGKITNEEGVGLSQVSIAEKGKKNGTITSEDGSFILSVNNSKTLLVVSSVGFISQEIPLNGQTALAVSLKSGNTKLEEVVVVGYGTQKKGHAYRFRNLCEGN